MKLLVIGDIHIKMNNLSEIRIFINRLSDCIEENEPEYIILLGDILDKHDVVYTFCLNLVNELLNICRSKSKVFVLVGNHDMTGPAEFLNTNHWMNAHKEWENITIVDEVVCQKIAGFRCTFVPYVENGRFIEALNTMPEEVWKKSNIIFAHQEFKGCKMGAIVSESGDEWPEDYPMVISGHIHSKQQPQKNIYYTGSALQHAFGESTENSILGIDSGGIFEEIDLDLPKKKIIYMKPDDLYDFEPEENCSTKIVISGDVLDYKNFTKTNKYKNLTKDRTVKIVFKNTKKEIQEEKDIITSLSNNEKTNFQDILYNLLKKEEGKYTNIIEEFKTLL